MSDNVCMIAIVIIFILNVIDIVLRRKTKGLCRRVGYMEGYNSALKDMTRRIGSCKKCEFYTNGLCIKNDIEPEETWFCADFKEFKDGCII